MPLRIFVSYRRDDAAGDAGRLADHLHRRFGAARVFLDIDTIEPGTDFVEVLLASLHQTAAMLVVIGPRWTSLRNADGTRRLDDPNDFVRLEVEGALRRSIPVVPVLVQGATMPRREDLPVSLAPLVTRQVAALDHAEFHADTERLCDRLATLIGGNTSTRWSLARRWWPAAALVAVLALALGGYRAVRTTDREPAAVPTTAGDVPASPGVADPLPTEPPSTGAPASTSAAPTNAGAASTPGMAPRRATALPGAARGLGATTIPSETLPAVEEAEARTAQLLQQTRRVEALLAEASAQRRRNQSVEALATLSRARELAPASETVRQTQEDVAMDWIRNVRVESGKSSFGEAIKPGLAVVDASLASAIGARRADLLAHSGWASFLMWRDGNRQLNPAEWYRDALSLDPGNPYANAMLAHWILFRENDVPRAVKLFDTALRAGRAVDAVRILQWGAYGNARTPEGDVQRVRLADAMRRDGQRLSMEQAQALWSPYYFAMPTAREKDRRVLLDAMPADDHISTLGWAFEEYAAKDESRRRTIRYYVALLHATAGRVDQAAEDLRTLDKELAKDSGSLREAVQTALKRL